MRKRNKRRCAHCGCLFEVCNKVAKHEYCKRKECQQARKRKWQKGHLKNDEAYKQDQKTAQEDWQNNNSGYWKKYRKDHPEYTAGNREKQHIRNQKRKATSAPIAKMEAITFENRIITGRYELVPVVPGMIAKMDALIVEIHTISKCYAYSGP